MSESSTVQRDEVNHAPLETQSERQPRVGPSPAQLNAQASVASQRIAVADTSPNPLTPGGGACTIRDLDLPFWSLSNLADPPTPGASPPVYTVVAGTYVVIDENQKVSSAPDATVSCLVQSGHNGGKAQIKVRDLCAQPRLSATDDRSKPGVAAPRPYEYSQVAGALWGNEGPTATDVAQGNIGDCYLVAAMTSLCTSDPETIKRLISPQQPHLSQYRVTLYRPNAKGTFDPFTQSVDTYMPSVHDDDNAHTPPPGSGYAPPVETPVYARNREGRPRALWPALLEKAYAQMMGGYDRIGDGGNIGLAMETLTGRRSDYHAATSDDDLVAYLLKAQAGKEAVSAGSVDHLEASEMYSRVTHIGSRNMYSFTLRNPVSDKFEVQSGTLRVSFSILDHSLPVHRDGSSVSDVREAQEEKLAARGVALTGPSMVIADNGMGQLTGPVSDGSYIDYNKHTGTFWLDEKALGGELDQTSLRASYKYRGVIDAQYLVYAWHAYVFESIDPTTHLITMRNPHGNEDPAPMPPSAFRRNFTELQRNAPAKAEASSGRR